MTHPFDKFTDGAAMREVFQARLWPLAEGGPKVLDCDILFAHHKSYLRRESRRKSYMTLCYRLRLATYAKDNRARGKASMFYAKAHLDDPGTVEVADAGASWYWPELKLALWRFPHDPKLPHLAEMIDSVAVRAYLPYDNLPTGYHASAAIARIGAAVIHYYPEERCTCRYDLVSAAPRASRPLSLFGKTFNDDRGESAYRRQLELWRVTQTKARKFIVARPLGYSAATKTLWLEQVAGVPAQNFLTGQADTAWLRAVAEGLADLHRVAPVGTVQYRRDDQLQELHSKSKKLAHGFPGLAESLKSLQCGLERDAASCIPSRQSFIHGDFHLRQLLVHGADIAFLDFDECGGGDALQDVASFIVDLHFYDLAGDQATRMGWRFLQAYERAADWQVPRDRLDWRVRLQLFTKAYRVYRQHQSGAERKIAALLELAERGIVSDAGVASMASLAGERNPGL